MNLNTQGMDTLRLRKTKGPWRRVFDRLLEDRYSSAAAIVLILIIVLGLTAPLYVPFDPTETNPADRMQGMSGTHWLGTDSLGRDLFSRVMSGTTTSLSLGIISVLIGLLFGGAIGLISAYFHRAESVLMRIVDILLAFPSILIALAVVATLGPGVEKAAIAVGIANIPLFARMARSQFISVAKREYVEASRSVGASNARLILKHVIPNALGVLIVYSTVRLGQAILMGTTLGFLGLGAQPPSPEWGAMVSSGRNFLTSNPIEVIVPSVAIFITVICANLLGDGLRDAMDPRGTKSYMPVKQRNRRSMLPKKKVEQ